MPQKGANWSPPKTATSASLHLAPPPPNQTSDIFFTFCFCLFVSFLICPLFSPQSTEVKEVIGAGVIVMVYIVWRNLRRLIFFTHSVSQSKTKLNGRDRESSANFSLHFWSGRLFSVKYWLLQCISQFAMFSANILQINPKTSPFQVGAIVLFCVF